MTNGSVSDAFPFMRSKSAFSCVLRYWPLTATWRSCLRARLPACAVCTPRSVPTSLYSCRRPLSSSSGALSQSMEPPWLISHSTAAPVSFSSGSPKAAFMFSRMLTSRFLPAVGASKSSALAPSPLAPLRPRLRPRLTPAVTSEVMAPVKARSGACDRMAQEAFLASLAPCRVPSIQCSGFVASRPASTTVDITSDVISSLASLRKVRHRGGGWRSTCLAALAWRATVPSPLTAEIIRWAK